MISNKLTIFILAFQVFISSTSACETLKQSEYQEKKEIFKNHGELGRGAFGVVYQSRVQLEGSSMPKTYAVKIITKPSHYSKPKFVKGFHRETGYLKKLEKCINGKKLQTRIAPKLHECAINEGQQALIVQELCSGTLGDKDFAKRYKDFLLSEKLDLIVILLDKLELMHDCGVIHCDIKPENILISEDGSDYYFSDYGLSAENGYCPGTTHYYAPSEYFTDENKSKEELFSHDVFALGVTFLMLEQIRSNTRITTMAFEKAERGERLQKNAASVFDAKLKFLERRQEYKNNYDFAAEISQGMFAGIQSMLDGFAENRSNLRDLITQFKMLKKLALLVENTEKITPPAFRKKKVQIEKDYGSNFNFDLIEQSVRLVV